jgi:hypothetical protein
MNKFDIYITLIIIIKIIFITLSFYDVVLNHKSPNDKEKIENIKYWKNRIEFLFIAMMSSLLIYLFNPYYNNMGMITSETKLLLYLFGFILILTADWSLFIRESPIVKDIKRSV